MKELFLTVLGMSAAASLVVLLILPLRLVLRRAPRIFSYALWTVVLFRLLCPVTLESALSLVPSVPVGSVRTAISVPGGTTDFDSPDLPAVEPGALGPVEAHVPAQADSADVSADSPKPAQPFDWAELGWKVWVCGMAGLLVWSLLALVQLRRRLIGAVGLAGRPDIRLADHIPSPFVLGVLRPKIYLPSNLPRSEWDYILLHERTHIRRGDHILRALAWLAVAVHWFNPLVWLAFHLAGRDMELSCDEAVLRRMGPEIRADYSASLLRLSAGPRLPAGPLAFGDGDPKGRIQHILNWKKPAFWVVIAAFLVVLAAGAALSTSRAPGEAAPPPEDTSEPILSDGDLSVQLSAALGEDGSVELKGSVGDFQLLTGTTWYPADEDRFPLGHLTMRYPPLDGPIDAILWASWADESRNAVTIDLLPTAMLSSYSQPGNLIVTVTLEAGQWSVTDKTGHIPKAAEGNKAQSITDGEAVKLARIAAAMLNAAEEAHASWTEKEGSGPVSTPAAEDLSALPELELAPVYELDDTWTCMAIQGLDCETAWWYSERLNAVYEVPEEARGYLCISGARFLGESFFAVWPDVSAFYDPEANQLWMDLIGPSGDAFCAVDLTTGAITDHEIPGFESVPVTEPGLTVREILPAARALAGLLQGAGAAFDEATDFPLETGPLPFDQPMKLWFGSGAGGWRTLLTLHADGSFEGEHSDGDAGVTYLCTFHGSFTDITKVTDASWSMTLKELVIDTGYEEGQEWYEDGYRYIASGPYGLDDAEYQTLEPGAVFWFYTPEATGHAPGTELYGLEEFLRWSPSKHAYVSARDTLGAYALRNAASERGFYDLNAWGIR